MYHARFGGSNAYRWTNCYGYLALADTLPRAPANRAAQEGSAQHGCMEMMLKDPDRWPDPPQFLNMTIEGVQITPQHVEAMTIALRDANEIMETCGPDATIWAERFYTFEQGEDRRHPLAGGSADLLCVDKPYRFAVCADFKFGAIEVASGSTQNKFYFAAAVRQHPELFEDVEKFYSVIIQPAYEPAKVETVYTRDDIDRFTTEFDIAIRQNERLSTTYNEGEWCTYCPAAIVCPAKTGALNTLIGHQPDTASGRARLGDMAQWWLGYKDLETVAEQVRHRLHHELDHGTTIDLLKLVARRTEPRWANPEIAHRAIMQSGVSIGDVVRLLTPQQAASILPDAVYQSLVHFPPGGTTIAPADDPRPAIVPQGALAAALRRLQR